MAYLLRDINQVSLAETLNVCLFVKGIQSVPNDANSRLGRFLSFLPSCSAVLCADCRSCVLLPKSCNKTVRQGGISWDCDVLKAPVVSEEACQYPGFPDNNLTYQSYRWAFCSRFSTWVQKANSGCTNNCTPAKDSSAGVFFWVSGVHITPGTLTPHTAFHRVLSGGHPHNVSFSVVLQLKSFLTLFAYLVLKARSSLYHQQCLCPPPGTF